MSFLDCIQLASRKKHEKAGGKAMKGSAAAVEAATVALDWVDTRPATMCSSRHYRQRTEEKGNFF